MLLLIMHPHVAWLSFSRLISIIFCELPLTYFHRLPERKLLSGGVDINAIRVLEPMTNVFIVGGIHDDVIKWKHFPRHCPFVRGIHRSPVNSLHKGQWRGALMLTLICARINGWANNGEAGDLRRHLAHYDVIVMTVGRLRLPHAHEWTISRMLSQWNSLLRHKLTEAEWRIYPSVKQNQHYFR